jgi:signal transduction histidine kinase
MFLKSFKTRITLLFTVIFLLCSTGLYFTAYVIISSSELGEERALLRSRLLEFWAVYETGNVDLVKKEVTLERMYKDERVYVLRIADRYNNTRLLYVPPGLTDFQFNSLEQAPVPNEGDLISLKNSMGGQELEIAALFLPDGNILEIGISNSQRIKTLLQFRNAFLLILLPLVAMSVLGGLFFASRFLTPVKKLVVATREIIETGSFGKRIPEHRTRDELGELITLFNTMLAKIETLVTGMRETLDTVAHDIRTPLTRLRGMAETALAATDSSRGGQCEMADALRASIAESEHVLAMLTMLLDISRAEAGIIALDKKETDLSLLLEDLIELYAYPASEKGITIQNRISAPLVVVLDVNRMRQAVSNLLENALKYTEHGQVIEFTAYADNDSAVIKVGDSGPGIAHEDLPLIWKRFYRSKDAPGPGFGLGLSVAKAIVEAHGGQISAESEPAKGAVFTIRLPLT